VSLLIKGAEVDVDGLTVRSWLDDPGMRLTPGDGRARRDRWIRSIVLHTTQGDEPQVVRSGAGPAGLAARTAAAWGHSTSHAGAHLVVDGDGTVWCLADLYMDVAYHATSMNEVSIGIELAQTRQLEIFHAQLDTTVTLCDAITRIFGIQRQMHGPYLGDSHAVPRLATGGKDCVGVFGHRDQTTDRGKGDPGDAVFEHLRSARYEEFNFADDDDLITWRIRQRLLGANGVPVAADGVPGPGTTAALRASGRARGLWVHRPGD
jgi:hypothetical protein